uniref:Germin-like protein n=1 Tax=Chenopodium quinoa TaxID=63459 RepID=A0A803MG53_CHEQI
MSNLSIFFVFCFFSTLSHAIEFNFCVGDPSLPRGSQGYACKDPAKVTTDYFVYTGFRGEKTPNNVFGNNVTLAFSNVFPTFNGLGISLARLDFAVGGVIPIHSHCTSEILNLVKGSIIAGFIDTNNIAYYNRLEVGDVMVFPQAMLHFQINVGKSPATAYVSLNGANPTLQLTPTSLFAENLPADIA